MAPAADPPLIYWGHCRSGARYFWTAQVVGGADAYGWAPNRHKAAQRANAAAVRLAAGQYANIRIRHEAAEIKLASVIAAKQAAAAAEPAAPESGYLYAIEPGHLNWETRQWIPSKVLRLPIVKRTAKRIYYSRPFDPDESGLGYVDRQALEAHGSVYSSRYLQIFAEPPELQPETPIIIRQPHPTAGPGLKELKAAMAAAHPDRGGTSEAFITARERYLRAKRAAA